MHFHTLPLLTCIGLLSACTTSVIVNSDFPEPLISALPLAVGLHYGESIKDYHYSEELPNGGTWSFDLGETNMRLFDDIFEALFEHTRHVDGTGGPDAQYSDLAAVIAPTLEALEFSLPRQSRSDQYAVWMRYNINVFTPDGNLITSWPVSAYGQSDSGLWGADKAMGQAAINAMRDAAASILTGFETEPRIKEALFTDEDDEESL